MIFYFAFWLTCVTEQINITLKKIILETCDVHVIWRQEIQKFALKIFKKCWEIV